MNRMLNRMVAAPAIDVEAGQKESERLSALDQFDLLDTPAEEAFDRICRLIRDIFDVPIALVSLMDGHRQWHKACLGVPPHGAERKDTFCRQPVASGQALVVEDARSDPRFADNPHVIGEPGIRFYAGTPLQTPDGHNIGTVCAIGVEPRAFGERDLAILTDLAQIAMDEITLRQRADTDVLTGLLSRRAFKEQGARSIALALRHRHPVSCIAMDIDHFKAVNDTHGHAAGDEVLKAVADACRAHLRASDIMGRLGGEEFAVLLPHTDQPRALDVAEKLRSAVRRTSADFGDVVLSVTASFGVAWLNPSTLDVDRLLANADEALYAAKAQGRDRCISAARDNSPHPSRRRVLKGGRIVFNNRHSTIDCTIRHLSEEGAGIDVWNGFDVPETFTLIMMPEAKERRCHVTARTGKHVEVEFSST